MYSRVILDRGVIEVFANGGTFWAALEAEGDLLTKAVNIENGAVKAFREKSSTDGAPINAGYMVLQPEVFDLLDGDECVFEKVALTQLAEQGQLMSYVHTGFWQCMDNIREKNMLEKLLQENKAPWKRWEHNVPISELIK